MTPCPIINQSLSTQPLTFVKYLFWFSLWFFSTQLILIITTMSTTSTISLSCQLETVLPILIDMIYIFVNVAYQHGCGQMRNKMARNGWGCHMTCDRRGQCTNPHNKDGDWGWMTFVCSPACLSLCCAQFTAFFLTQPETEEDRWMCMHKLKTMVEMSKIQQETHLCAFLAIVAQLAPTPLTTLYPPLLYYICHFCLHSLPAHHLFCSMLSYPSCYVAVATLTIDTIVLPFDEM